MTGSHARSASDVGLPLTEDSRITDAVHGASVSGVDDGSGDGPIGDTGSPGEFAASEPDGVTRGVETGALDAGRGDDGAAVAQPLTMMAMTAAPIPRRDGTRGRSATAVNAALAARSRRPPPGTARRSR